MVGVTLGTFTFNSLSEVWLLAEGEVRPRTGREGTKWEYMCNAILSLTSALNWWWVVDATPWPL